MKKSINSTTSRKKKLRLWKERINNMTRQDLSISYKSKRSEFPKKYRDWKFEDHKVRLFQEQTQGWVIDVAREIKDKEIGHADFAVLSILLSYFENIAKYKVGYIKTGKDGKSAFYFRKGIRMVFPRLKSSQKSKIQDLLYNQTRNGMYHVGLTGASVELDCIPSSALTFKNKRLIICPEKIIDEIQKHFDKYCTELKKPANKSLRSNFEKRAKFVWGVKK